MRMLSLILALGLVIAGSSLAGSPDSTLPGIGTFSYGAASMTVAAQPSGTVAR